MARGLLLCLACLGLTAGQASAAPGWASLRPVGFGVPETVFMAADLTPAGAATVAWVGVSGGHQVVLAASGASGGVFSPPVVVSRGTGDVGRPALAVSPQGVAVLTWSRESPSGQWVVQAAMRSSAGKWSPPEPLSDPSENPPQPSAAIADSGEAMVVWLGEVSGFDDLVQVARRPVGGAWGQPDTLNASHAEEAHVVMDRLGNATVLWMQEPSTPGLAAEAAFTVLVRPRGGAWSVQSFGHSGRTPHLAVGPDGRVAAIWQTGTTVRAAIRPPGGAWGAPEQVADVVGSYPGERPQIALDGAGAATAVMASQAGRVTTNRRTATGAWAADDEPLVTGYFAEIYWPAVTVNARGFALTGYLGVKDGSPDPLNPGIPIVHASPRLPGAAWMNPVGLTDGGGVTAIDVDGADNGLVCWISRTTVVYCRAYDATPPRLLDLAVPATGVAERPVAFGVRPVDTWSALGTTTWNFGDSTSATGTRPTHTYAAAGRYTVRVTARDALGNATSAQRVVNVAPAPPVVTIDDAAFRRAGFARSRLRQNARVLVTGTMSAPLGVAVRLTGPVRPRAARRTFVLGTRQLGPGEFSERVRIPAAVAAKLLPGRYELKVTGPGLVPDASRLKLRAPPQGVVMAHRISTSRRGPNLLRVTNAKRLWATFTFAPGAGSKLKLRAVWYAPGTDKPVGSFPVKRAFSWLANPNGLAKGRWRCVLVARGRVVDSVSLPVG